jgi:hypothetical protein
MPTLALINFNIVCATLGGFVSLFGLVSYLCKERFYLSEACKQFSPLTKLPLQLMASDLIRSDLASSGRRILPACREFHPPG